MLTFPDWSVLSPRYQMQGGRDLYRRAGTTSGAEDGFSASAVLPCRGISLPTIAIRANFNTARRDLALHSLH